MDDLRAGPFSILVEDLDHPEGVVWSPGGVLKQDRASKCCSRAWAPACVRTYVLSIKGSPYTRFRRAMQSDSRTRSTRLALADGSTSLASRLARSERLGR